MITARYYPYLGGIESHVHEVTPRLIDLGYDVDVITCDPSHELAQIEVLDGVRVRRFPAGPRRSDWMLSPGLARHVSRGGYDLAHVQGIHTGVPPAALVAARVARMPTVLTFHTGGYSRPLRNRLRGVQFAAIAPLLRRCTALIGVSEFEARRFRDIVGPNGPDVVVVRNGGSLPAPTQPVVVDPNLVLSVGRLEFYKGHHRLIEALPALRDRRPGARLRILGAGPYREDLLRLAGDRGVADAVDVGQVPPQDRQAMAREVAAAAVVALLSDYEAHPVAVMEALTLNRPVLVARTSGLTELETGGLVRGIPLEAGPAVTAEALLLQMDHPLEIDTASLPTWESCAASLDGIYRRVLSRGAGSD